MDASLSTKHAKAALTAPVPAAVPLELSVPVPVPVPRRPKIGPVPGAASRAHTDAAPGPSPSNASRKYGQFAFGDATRSTTPSSAGAPSLRV